MRMDTTTGFVILGLLYIILPLTVYLILKDYKHASVKLWALGGVFVGFGLGLVGLRPLYQAVMPDYFTYTFVQSLTVIGYTMRIQSLRVDIKKPLSNSVLIFSVLLFIVIFQSILGLVHLRVVTILFWIAALVFFLVLAAYEYEKKYQIKHIRFIWVTYSLLCFALSLRGILVIFGLDDAIPLNNSLPNNLLVFSALLTVIYSNLAYIGVMLARVEKESEISIQKNINLLNAINKQTNVIKDLMRVQAFSVVGTYGTTVVHEVLQPLTAMRFALENLKMYVLKKSPDTTTQERIEAVDSSAARAIGVVENLRNFIVEREVQVGQVSLNKVMRDVIAITSGRSRALGVNVALKINEEISVMADEHQLQRVLFNIVNNALDSIERNPDIQPDRRVLIDAKYVQQKQFVLIKVIDSGVGLASKDQAEIFEWLSTGSSKGMGIGLALSKMLVESWRGHISAYNADPKVDGLSGAIFELKLQGA